MNIYINYKHNGGIIKWMIAAIANLLNYAKKERRRRSAHLIQQYAGVTNFYNANFAIKNNVKK